MDPVTISAAIAAASAGINLINKIAGQVVPFLTGNAPIPKEHRMMIEGTPTEIVATMHGKEVKVITGNDLQNLPSNIVDHISVYNASAEKQYALWKVVYPQRNDSSDPVVNAKVDQQLKKIVADMKDDLDGILDFLVSCGIQLDDHYMQFRDAIRKSS